MSNIFDKLFILEMANNHMGDLDHGLKLIREFHKVSSRFDFNFAFKFQYRDLDSFIHPDFKDRMDIKYIKRFSETRFSEEQFLKMKEELDKLGFVSVCTPFDEKSVELVEKHGYKILKIASCSFTDWPLLERIAQTSLPIIASTAGASLGEIDQVVSFFEHRDKELCLMHCVGAYPTPDKDMELNQISFFKARYSNLPIGYSTHESPDNVDAVKMAIAKGAVSFERHVGLPTEKYAINGYSSTPEQLENWLEAAKSAYEMCGISGARREISEKEQSDLKGLQRGVFAKQDIKAGSLIDPSNTFYAIPNIPGQLLANDISKYNQYTATADIAAGQAVVSSGYEVKNRRDKILEIVRQLSVLLKKSGIKLQNKLELELSHHYGIDKFDRWGCSIINCINREYCKKIILLLPGQENPCHSHKLKEETFHVLYGDIELVLNGVTKTYHAGEMIIVERNSKHSFSSVNGAIFEEVSTTHYKNDSFYDDQKIMESTDRKTQMTFWTDWLFKEIQ